MLVAVRHTETAHRVVLEVELDQHGRLVAHHPAIVTRLDDHHLRSAELHDAAALVLDRKSTRLNSSHLGISYAVFCSPKQSGRSRRIGRSERRGALPGPNV